MEKTSEKGPGWEQADPASFWRQIAREQHVLQTYSSNEELVESLFTFVDDGIKSNDAVLIISTLEHRHLLDDKLRANGHNPLNLKLKDQYICLDASEMMAEFMIDGMPDPLLFRYALTDLIHRAKRNYKRVRAFGEMVAILWDGGNQIGAIALEHLWNVNMHMDPITLFCAYPEQATAATKLFEEVHRAHGQYLATKPLEENQLLFRPIQVN